MWTLSTTVHVGGRGACTTACTSGQACLGAASSRSAGGGGGQRSAGWRKRRAGRGGTGPEGGQGSPGQDRAGQVGQDRAHASGQHAANLPLRRPWSLVLRVLPGLELWTDLGAWLVPGPGQIHMGIPHRSSSRHHQKVHRREPHTLHSARQADNNVPGLKEQCKTLVLPISQG